MGRVALEFNLTPDLFLALQPEIPVNMKQFQIVFLVVALACVANGTKRNSVTESSNKTSTETEPQSVPVSSTDSSDNSTSGASNSTNILPIDKENLGNSSSSDGNVTTVGSHHHLNKTSASNATEGADSVNVTTIAPVESTTVALDNSTTEASVNVTTIAPDNSTTVATDNSTTEATVEVTTAGVNMSSTTQGSTTTTSKKPAPLDLTSTTEAASTTGAPKEVTTPKAPPPTPEAGGVAGVLSKTQDLLKQVKNLGHGGSPY